MDGSAIELRHLGHRYGEKRALQDVSFSIPYGSLFGLLGPNGGGKTTLFRILSTLIIPESGSTHVCGFDTAVHPAEVRRHLGVVFQQPALDDELTVSENLRVHGALYGIDSKTIRHRIEDLLERFGLTDRADDRVKTLSGGLARRADLARGLLHTPRVLLLDEPTTGLDPAARHAFWDAIGRLRKEEKTTIVVATHLLNEAATCNQVAILDRGHIVALGNPDDLKGEIGEQTLWLEAESAEDLCERITARFGCEARVLGDMVQVMDSNAYTLLPGFYEAFGSRIRSATVRKPTLEDVFMVRAGHSMPSVEASEAIAP